MILVFTNSEDVTADYLCERLQRETLDYFRFDTDADLSKFAIEYNSDGPALIANDFALPASSIAQIWYRRPKPLKKLPAPPGTPEAYQIAYEWSEALEGLLAHAPMAAWMNHPAFNVIASHKIEQLTRAKRLGFSIPPTLVTQSPESLRTFWRECEGDVIVKPLGCGYIERERQEDDSLIFTSAVKLADLDEIESLKNCPTLFQRRIDKVSDVRIAVVDDEVTSVAMLANDDGRQRLDIRRNNMSDVRYEPIEMPANLKCALLALVRSYNLRFAAIDMAIDANGDWQFFEINPNGQWAWIDLAGAADIAGSFVRAFSGNALA